MRDLEMNNAIRCLLVSALLFLIVPASASALTFATVGPFDVEAFPYSVAIADFNGDGRPDLVTANADSDSVTVLLQTTGGSFAPSPTGPFETGNDPTSVAVGDINDDTNPDLVTANALADTVTVLLGDGTGAFTEAAQGPIDVGGDGPTTVVIGDLGGDTKLDLAVANADSDNVAVLIQDSAGSFSGTSGSPYPAGNHPNAVALGDLNGDGKLDLATSNASDNSITVLFRGPGAGFASAPGSPYNAGRYPTAVAIGNVDFNPSPDLVVANSESDNLTILLGDGSGALTPAPGSPVSVSGNGPVSVGIGDLNSDGRTELATANGFSNNVSVLIGDNSGSFTQAGGSPFSAGSTPFSIAIGDLGGDGMQDLVTANANSDDVTVLTNTSNPIPPTADMTISPTGDDFGDRLAGSGPSAPKSFTITSTGAAALDVGSVSLAGSAPGEFELSGTSACTLAPLPTGQTCEVVADFAPTVIGVSTARIQVDSNASNSPVTAQLLGTGTKPPVEPPPAAPALKVVASPAKAKMKRGRVAILKFRVKNVGTAAANGAKICLKAPKKVLAPGRKCWSLGRIAAGSSRVRKPSVRMNFKGRKGKTYTVSFTGTAAKTSKSVARVKLKAR